MGFVPIWEPFPEWKNAYGSVANHLDTQQGPPSGLTSGGKDPEYFKEIMKREKAYLDVLTEDKAGTIYDVLDFDKGRYPYPLTNDPSANSVPKGNGMLLKSLSARVNDSIEGRLGTRCLVPHKIYTFIALCRNIPGTAPSPTSDAADFEKWNATLNEMLSKKYIFQNGDFYQKEFDENGVENGKLTALFLGELDAFKAMAAAGIPNPRLRLTPIPGLFDEGRQKVNGPKVDLSSPQSIQRTREAVDEDEAPLLSPKGSRRSKERISCPNGLNRCRYW